MIEELDTAGTTGTVKRVTFAQLEAYLSADPVVTMYNVVVGDWTGCTD